MRPCADSRGPPSGGRSQGASDQRDVPKDWQQPATPWIECVMWLWVKTNGIPFWEVTTHFRTYFNGDWDVHGVRDFDPWPCVNTRVYTVCPLDMPCSGRNHFFRRPCEWNSRRVCWVQNWRYPTHPSALEIVGPRRRPRHGKRVSTHPERGYPHFSPPGGRVGNLELPARVVKNCKPKWPHDFSLHLAHPH